MAIDTREKALAVVGVGRPWMRTKLPIATPDEQWRASSAHSYGGNALSPAGGGFEPQWANNANVILQVGL